MPATISKTTATFSRPFRVPGFDEMIPAGDYAVETELRAPIDHLEPENWKASVLVHLHPRKSHPGLARSLTVSLADLESALAKDKLSGKELELFVLEEMLSDPMVRLMMRADGYSDAELRHLYTNAPDASVTTKPQLRAAMGRSRQDRLAETSRIQAAENEGMPTLAADALGDPEKAG